MRNTLFVLREQVADELIDLIYLDPFRCAETVIEPSLEIGEPSQRRLTLLKLLLMSYYDSGKVGPKQPLHF